jgi:hypothetical protein
MAEYVRRRRPPANHPYWERLHDRANPPSIVGPIALLAAIGLCIGLYGGLRSPISVGGAVKTATTVSWAFAMCTFALALPLLLYDASRQTPRRQRWAGAAIGAVGVAMGIFALGIVGLVPILLWYAACSGEGPWLGMLIGGLIGAAPAALYAWASRRRWKDRQRRWPRWENMRVPRTRAALNVTPVPAPTEMAPAGDTSGPLVDKDRGEISL